MDLTERGRWQGPRKLGGFVGAVFGGGLGAGAVILGTGVRILAGDSFDDARSKSADLGGAIMMKCSQLGDETDHTLSETIRSVITGRKDAVE